jgi:hypothetical protein
MMLKPKELADNIQGRRKPSSPRRGSVTLRDEESKDIEKALRCLRRPAEAGP